MKTSYDKVMNFVLESEGGYIHDPDDPGGETNFGISKRVYPNVDIKNLTLEKAKEIYRKDYWDRIHGDSLPYPLDMCAMDTAVNCGVKTAADMLRRNNDYRDFLLDRMNYYISISARNTALQKFFRGWIIRVNKLRALCRG